MGLRQREWARKVRDQIFDRLGRKCVKCGAVNELEFDIIFPLCHDSPHSREWEWSWRMSFYRKQLNKGNLQILCTHCNSKKSNKGELISQPEVDEPF